MKSCLTILTVLAVGCLMAQPQPPVAFANTYRLSDAEGFTGFNYVLPIFQASNGKLYAMDDFSEFTLIGNNYSVRTDFFKKQNTKIASFYELPGN